MGLLDNFGKKGKAAPPARTGGGGTASSSTAVTRPGGKGRAPATKGGKGSKLPGKKKGAKDRVTGAAAPLHDRRRRLVSAREATLRDLGGLMLEMYKRNRFREELLLDKCEEVLAVEVEIAHIDQRLFQLAPPNAAGMRPIGRCDCGAPIHPGQNFCGLCGRSFTTLTQVRMCERCGAGLRPGDTFCASCGTQAPDLLEAIEAPRSSAPPGSGPGAVAPAEIKAPGAPSVESRPSMQVPSIDDAAAETSVIEATVATPPSSKPSPAAAQPGPNAAPGAAATPAPLETIAPPPVPLEPLTPGEGAPSGTLHADPTISQALQSLPSELQFPNADPAAAAATPTITPTPVAAPHPAGPADTPAAAPAAAPAAGEEARPAPSPAEERKLAKEKAKRLEKLKKDKAKAQKERAKARLKAARAAKKHGDGGS